MRFETLAIFTFASLATATFAPNPWDPLDVRPLAKCQANCVRATLPKLGEGKFVILQTPNEYFCASPDLMTWLRDDLFTCGAAVCGRNTERFAKRGMMWLHATCPSIAFNEAELAPPAGAPAAGAPAGAPSGSPAGQPGAEPSGAPAAAPAGPEGSEPAEGPEGQ
ncbi:hypothetical protein MCOR27_009385 [Pyricularia oryzae]|uniref:Uncharacterized protein n=4 Tax=Pyricularia TaxID=48558 RepID=A0ABQ8NW37_PYRGI|nr:uncharacterized protein MGG_02296 [Pyricularia oryzae 70-15]ELQ41150.1 hypothetical protein OOU_Y34scaffold00298g2 [Pyricularia oryzae Y34]KAH8842826.1 hypothetical protein MCOR01_006722 [Pyricularia oryzae]KAI6302960.1 hypothetical protein MCOR33_001737 [Pyricularia grisea]EHA56450.1 hypothetical protein MGG_02296 [Pyricularia oryzae 70-15]KAH9436043.1 hypothetical protein MCOR02_004952 [Pyricularia oryzae]